MSEFICGVIFFVIGVALLIYNKSLVQKSSEFYPRSFRLEVDRINLFNRFLCVLTGLVTSVIGFLIMLSSNK
jgi:hypothetical protein